MKFLNKILSKLFFKSQLNPKLTNTGSEKTWDEKQNENGVFIYNDDGFSIRYEDFFAKIKWDEIIELNVYKKDQITIDRIEMEIVYGEKAITISEDLPGWYQFVIKTKSLFPAIPKDWDLTIIHPAFATNWRNIFTKTN